LLQFFFSEYLAAILSDPPLSKYLPEGIGQRLIELHPDPKAFWIGQFAHYLMRDNKMID
jgi:hypothetical protein